VRPANEVDLDIDAVENGVYEAAKRIAELRKERAPEPVGDYELTASDGTRVRLSALFGEKRDLVLVHNMGRKCPMCTTWGDGFNGVRHHLEDRAAFVVSSPDAPDVQREFAASRGWGFRMVSVKDTSLAADLGFRDAKGNHWPGMSVLWKTDDRKVVRVAKTGFGPGDPYSPVFNVLPLLRDGQGEWWPKLSY
jgi:predicted dithiol-disulfide oxidoreductase (DUF899 family)